MPVTTSSSIQRQPFQQTLGVELPPRQEKPPAPPRELAAPAPQVGVPKLSLGLLETLCPRELVDRVLVEAGREGKRNRLLPPWLVVYALLLMCLSGTMGYGRLMRELATQAVSWKSPAGRSAFGKARMQLGWEVLAKLFEALAKPLGEAQLDADCCFWRGRRVVAIDGTTFALPVNEELETEFGGQIANDGSQARVGVPQARLVSLIECGTRALLAVALGAYEQGEGSLARQLEKALGPGMIVLADRCFPAKPLWLLYTATGADLLWRVKSNLARRHLRELGDGSYLVNFGKGQPVQMRVIEYRRRGHPEIYRLITNLLDPVAAPAQELALLYSQRWEIELVSRELKCDQAEQAPLRSKTADGVRQEIYAHCLLHTLNRQLVYAAAATTPERDPDRISFTVAMDVLHLSLRHAKTAGRRAMAGLSQWAINQLVACDPLIRRARSCPRAVYRKLDHFINR
ncbi:MAG TPA: IS4 family transposase, partial [Candidatus Dormibacteraeota bacterium]|nr:IS4 family transposase [Candidatus Dormibacteraeota bacterium]